MAAGSAKPRRLRVGIRAASPGQRPLRGRGPAAVDLARPLPEVRPAPEAEEGAAAAITEAAANKVFDFFPLGPGPVQRGSGPFFSNLD